MRKAVLTLIAIYLVFVSVTMTGCFSKSKGLTDTSSRQLEQLTQSKMDISTADNILTGVQSEAKADIKVKNTNIKKVIRDANVSIEVKNSDEDFKKISIWVIGNGGYEFSRNVSFNGKYKNITVVYKVPPEKLNSFLEFLDGTGKVNSSNLSSNDITDQYYDIAARVENLKKGRDQLIEIQKKAVTIDEILRVQNELNRITGEIESLQGRINIWDKLVAESTVNLTINQEADPIRQAEEISWKFSSFSDILKTAKSGFIWTANTLINILVWIVIALVSLSPVLAVAGLAVVIIRILKRKKKE